MTNSMQTPGGVTGHLASAADLATFSMVMQQINAMSVPLLYAASNPKARVSFALFDGIANDGINGQTRKAVAVPA